MMRRTLPLLALSAALAGCSLFRANPADDTEAKQAALVGAQVGMVACTVALRERPTAAPVLADAVARGHAVLAAPDPTLAALAEALAHVSDVDVAFYAQLGLSSLLATLAASGVDVQTVEPGSPLAVGVAAMLEACSAVAGGQV